MLLMGVFLLGIVTSYEDHKHRQIRNKWILLALLYALAAYIAVILLILLRGGTINIEYFRLYGINVIFAFITALIIWWGGLWSAGDAKLFIAYTALIPLSLYRFGYVQYFPSYVLLINTFVPIFLYYTVKALVRTKSKAKVLIVKEMLHPSLLLSTALFVFGFYWPLSLLSRFVPLLQNIIVIILVLFGFLLFVKRVLRINHLYAAAVLSGLALILDFQTIFTLAYLKSFAVILLIFVFLRYFILNLTYSLFTRPVYIEDLKAGTIPAENFMKLKGEYAKKRIIPISFISSLIDRMDGVPLFSNPPDGLTEAEVSKVQQLHSHGTIKEHSLLVHQTMSFAPFLFFGAITTTLLKGDFLTAIRVAIEKFI